MTDWEDIEAGPCDEGNCLYIADTGDNGGSRKSVAVYRVPEPASGNNGAVNATKISLEYPEGPEDAEAIFVACTQLRALEVLDLDQGELLGE